MHIDSLGFSVCQANGESEISYLLFADVTLISCKAQSDQLLYLRCVLLCFVAILRLKVNLAKSKQVQGGELRNVEELMAFLGCKVFFFPATYLGLPLGAQFELRSIWDGVLKRLGENPQGGREYIFLRDKD